ncbi:MAG: tetratricopeptide repeat protein [Chloroflexota bacterium]
MRYARERALLAQVARDVYRRHRGDLERLKEDSLMRMQRPDFLWHRLVKTFAMWGGTGGWDRLTADSETFGRLAYEALVKCPATHRRREIQEVMKQTGIRFPNKKARLLEGCFRQIEEMGGPKEAGRILLEQDGPEGKIRFLKSLPGVGPKSARNVMMGLYDKDFLDHIAVDARIRRISKSLGLEFGNYAEHEAFYLRVAEEAGMTGWELDRLMFNYTDEFLGALEDRAQTSVSDESPAGQSDSRGREAASGEPYLPTGFSFPFRPARAKKELPPEELEGRLRRQLRKQEEALERTVWRLAGFYSRTGRQGVAISTIERLIPRLRDPDKLATAYLSLGQLMEQLEDCASAIQYYREALRLKPANRTISYLVHNNLGYCLNLQGETDEAEEYCRAAIEVNPSRYNAYKNLGRSLELQGRFLEAAENYVKATKLNAADSRALGHLEDLLARHPGLLEKAPTISGQLEKCRQAADFARRIKDRRREAE